MLVRLVGADVVASSSVLPVAAWAVVVPMLIIVGTQVLGITGGRLMAVAQALSPYLLLAVIPIAAAALWWHRWVLGIAAAVVFVVLVELSWPLLFPRSQPDAQIIAPPLRVLHSNVLYHNALADQAADTLLSSDADVVVITEYSPRIAAALNKMPRADTYRHRIEQVACDAAGTAIWSRHPMRARVAPETYARTVVGDVSYPHGGIVRIIGVHPPPPTVAYDTWRSELRQLVDLADASLPMVVIGDFNASWWHPGFRALFDDGFRDAHQVVGHGFSVSWPTGRRAPAFIRLDHALVNAHLVVDGVEDLDVPGSDHRGFTVTVRPASCSQSIEVPGFDRCRKPCV